MSIPPLRGLRFYLQPEISSTDPFLKLSASIAYNPLTGYLELPPIGAFGTCKDRYSISKCIHAAAAYNGSGYSSK
jgi:hypothetical protein